MLSFKALFFAGRAASAVCCLLVLVSCSTPQVPMGSNGNSAASATMGTDQDRKESPLAKRPVKLGLALGGGAARGFAHVGVFQVLEEAGIKPQLVVGTSAGSVVAALYTSGKSASQLLKLSESMDESALTDWTVPLISRGMMRGDALAKYMSQNLEIKKIEEMKIPLGVVATDLHSGESILFQRGDAATAVRASSAVPAVFQPVQIGGKEYVDGGLVAPVPVRFARQMGADIVLAIDISTPLEANKADGMLQILLQTFSIMGKSISDLELKEADLVVKPALSGIGSAAFNERKRSIEAGRVAMTQALPQLKILLQKQLP